MKKRGKGIAVAFYPTGMGGGGDFTNAIVKIKPDGTADLIVGTVELGQGASTVLPQMAAEVLELGEARQFEVAAPDDELDSELERVEQSLTEQPDAERLGPDDHEAEAERERERVVDVIGNHEASEEEHQERRGHEAEESAHRTLQASAARSLGERGRRVVGIVDVEGGVVESPGILERIFHADEKLHRLPAIDDAVIIG